MIKNKLRNCPHCEAADAAAHPLAVGAVVTVLASRSGCLVAEGIAAILRPAGEPDVYFIRFRGEVRIKKRLVFADYQRDPARVIDIVTRHLVSACPLPSTPLQPPTGGECL
jgi:hypothetical protein